MKNGEINMNWFNLLLKSVVMVLLVTPVFSETQITGGLLTCTPNSLDKTPSVYMFNSEYLIKQDEKEQVYRKLGEFSTYKVYVGLIPDEDLLKSKSFYNKSVDYFLDNPEQSVEYLTLLKGGCENDKNYSQSKMRKEFSSNETYKEKVGDVPGFWGVTCRNISKVLESGELPKPRLTDDNHHISKLTINTRKWTVTEENSQFCEDCTNREGDNIVFGRSFWNSTTSCVVVKLDKVEIDVTEDLVDEDEV